MKFKLGLLFVLATLAGTIAGRILTLVEVANFFQREISDSGLRLYLETSVVGAKRTKVAVESLIWDYYTGLLVMIFVSILISLVILARNRK